MQRRSASILAAISQDRRICAAPARGELPPQRHVSSGHSFSRISMKLFAAVLATCLSLCTAARADQAAVERGRYLAILGDCAGCHTVPGKAAYSGGLSFNTPFGILYSTNITPDRETGIGDWSETDFSRALHDGVAPGGKHLYPALPYVYFNRITPQETADLFA